VAVQGDPLSDVNLLYTSIAAVMKDGRVVR
jgi:imidazolonepropionase-like amidohydrolase